jgi:biopolymer transport protein ExbD
MGAKVGGSKGGPMADINVTPLVDVVLVLLIIFMVITPMLSSGIDVRLPLAKTATETQDVGQHLVVGIRDNPDGSTGVFIETTPTSMERLMDDLMVEYKKKGDRSILIKASSTLRYGEVRKVTDQISEGGITTMLLATDRHPDAKTPPKEQP